MGRGGGREGGRGEKEGGEVKEWNEEWKESTFLYMYATAHLHSIDTGSKSYLHCLRKEPPTFRSLELLAGRSDGPGRVQ